jgi:hypothetical protein
MNPNIVPIAFIVAGILVFFVPRILNYVVALALVLYGLHELNKIHKFAPDLLVISLT